MYMQSNCSAYEILFCDANTGKQITNPSEVKDVKWGTWTCTLGMKFVGYLFFLAFVMCWSLYYMWNWDDDELFRYVKLG
jgi:hypothetical protein